MLRYRTGQEIKKLDQVRFHGNPAQIELVSCDPNEPDPNAAWYVKEFGGGVLVRDPIVSGMTFIPSDQLSEYQDLEFVARAQADSSLRSE
jgi:hypothetical protein